MKYVFSGTFNEERKKSKRCFVFYFQIIDDGEYAMSRSNFSLTNLN